MGKQFFFSVNPNTFVPDFSFFLSTLFCYNYSIQYNNDYIILFVDCVKKWKRNINLFLQNQKVPILECQASLSYFVKMGLSTKNLLLFQISFFFFFSTLHSGFSVIYFEMNGYFQKHQAQALSYTAKQGCSNKEYTTHFIGIFQKWSLCDL